MSATAQKENGRARNPRAPLMNPLPTPEPIAAIPASLAAALSAFQGAVPTFPKSKTARVQTRTGGEYSYKFADLGDILPIVGPLLAEVGLSWSGKPRLGQDGTMVLAYRLLHVCGEVDEGEIPLGVARDCKPQELGSAITYARRYAMTAQLNLSTEQDDDAGMAQTSSVGPDAHKPVQPAAAPAKPSARPATAKQRDLIKLRGRKAELEATTFANVVKVAAGDEAIEWSSEEAATRWLERAIDRLPAKLVDAVLEAIAAASEGSPS